MEPYSGRGVVGQSAHLFPALFREAHDNIQFFEVDDLLRLVQPDLGLHAIDAGPSRRVTLSSGWYTDEVTIRY
jgi:hypothetical protein